MTQAKIGTFTIDYTLFTSPNDHDADVIQFGMDFILISATSKPLMQLIFPVVAVGNNIASSWNIDNHTEDSSLTGLVYNNAFSGTIIDTPREALHKGQGVKSTKFAVYILDIPNNTVQSTGVSFGYTINTSDAIPSTQLISLVASNITNEQKSCILKKCPKAKFSNQ